MIKTFLKELLTVVLSQLLIQRTSCRQSKCYAPKHTLQEI
jgi:hypothetical protein